MRKLKRSGTSRSGAGWMSVVRRAGRDDSGATAVEFAMIATPFFALLFGTFGIGIYQFTQFSLQNAVDQAARQIRTGTYQTGGATGGVMTTQEFKTAVCSKAAAFIDCTSKLKVFIVTPGTSFSSATTNAPACTAADPASTTTTVTAGSNTIVLVLACYTFDLAASLPYLQLGPTKGSAAVIQASSVFKTEPGS